MASDAAVSKEGLVIPVCAVLPILDCFNADFLPASLLISPDSYMARPTNDSIPLAQFSTAFKPPASSTCPITLSNPLH